jgi:hypothetical protein
MKVFLLLEGNPLMPSVRISQFAKTCGSCFDRQSLYFVLPIISLDHISSLLLFFQ